MEPTTFKLEIREREPGTYEIIIDGEDDTIGNLISTYLELSEEIQLSYYTRPHPLKEQIIIYVKLKDPKADLRKVLNKVLNSILEDLEDIRAKYKNALKKLGVELEE